MGQRSALVSSQTVMNVGEKFARFKDVEHGLSSLARNVDSDFSHRFDCHWIECARFQPRAVRFKMIATDIVEKRFGHLAAGAVMDADE
jgi:hypothetical protein